MDGEWHSPFGNDGDDGPRLSAIGINDRPVIRIATGKIEDIVDQAEDALIKSGRGLYQRANAIVGVGEAKLVASDRREIGGQRIFERGEHALFEDLSTAAAFEKYDGRSKAYVRTEPPMKLVKILRERTGRLRFPVLAGIVNAPTLRPDGTLLDAPGYDEATGLLFDPCGAVFPKVFDRPSRGQAEDALHLLRDLISTFPFVGEADRSVALSGLLTACCRRALRTAPMHASTAPVAGSGKSTLVDIASVIATGREAGVIAQGKTEEETEKRLGLMLLAGDQVVAIDNCEQPLGGEFLCQVLTQPVVRVRVLGQSQTPELPTSAFITATGNNLTLAGDMTRRALLCSLDPKVERPELRKFDRDPIATVKADRGVYVAAVLTILRAHIAAGRPKQCDPLGSFTEWSDLVRSSLLWLGCADPVATMEAARARDPRLDDLQAVISQWDKIIGDERVSVRDVITKAVARPAPNPFESSADFTHPEFREALLAVAGQGGAINSKRLGKWLASNAMRIIAGAFFKQDGLYTGIMTWKLAGKYKPSDMPPPEFTEVEAAE